MGCSRSRAIFTPANILTHSNPNMAPKSPIIIIEDADGDSESDTSLRPGEDRGPYVLTEHEQARLNTVEENEKKRAKKEKDEKDKFDEETSDLLAVLDGVLDHK